MKGFLHKGRVVFALIYRLECPPPQIVELVVPLDRHGNATSAARPADAGKRMVNVRPGDFILHGKKRHRVVSVDVFRSLAVG